MFPKKRFPKKRFPKKELRLEQLELRCTPTVVCNANPTYAAECAYLGNLIPQSAISDTAVKSGNWSDPATWGGRVPGNGDNVWIPNGIAVTVDGQEPGALRSVLDNGLLQFATNVNTSLLVDTIVVGTEDANGIPRGELDIGTLANPIQPGVTAKLTFADTGTLTQAWPNDPEQLARGLISMNTVSIVGATVTPYDTAYNTNVGSTSITLGSVPTGWKAGDTLLLPGTSPTANQDEQIKIQAINGDTVTLASPLQFTHSTVPGQNVYVADEARNVIFQSQNTTDYERFGHVMFMHTDQEVVENADFCNLGRTNKSLPLGATNPDGTKNVVGRYAVHFHRDYWPTMSENDPPILVSGNFEMGSPGWGYDNHSSNVDMEDNVAFDNNGAGFVTEAGNEIGTFNANLAVRTTGVANGTDYFVNTSRNNINDFGFTGSGFWMQSPSVSLINNIALDDTTGFQFLNQGLDYAGSLGQITAWNGQNTESVPLAGFSGNIAAESTDGVELFLHLPITMPLAPGTQSVINDFTAWDVTVGVNVGQWAGSIAIRNSSLAAVPGFISKSVGVNISSYAGSVNAFNDQVVGFALGANSPAAGIDNTVSGGYWDDLTGFEITQQSSTTSSNRSLSYSGVAFGPDARLQYQWDSQRTYESTDPNTDFVPQQVYINGVEAYFANQGGNDVPFPTSDANIPDALIGLTNTQLMRQYGLAMEGEIGSSQSQAAPFWYGLNPYKSQVKVSSPTYTVSYYTPEGVVTEATPITLQPGWNLLTRIVDGMPHSWLVGYDAPVGPPAPQNSVGSSQVVGGVTSAFTLTQSTSGSTLEVTGTSSQGATQACITIIDAGVTWYVGVAGNGLYIEKNGAVLKTLAINTSATYSFSLTLDTSADTLGVVINGVQYL
ncbi:MAG TPA: G8 domain-containing protein [Pirellulales bacterium]|nr:G8 domain-containing protein [Pirellulales bacterium]